MNNKKKTIEEKAKAYDEKINQAKEMLKDGTISQNVIDYIQHLFPELKESEDERIRKALIAYCQVNMGHTWHNIKQEDYIAWLEKQGNQNLPSVNERAWLYLIADVLTWNDGIGQYLDDPRVQKLAKKLCSEYAQKLYNFPISSYSSNIENNEQESSDTIKSKFHEGDWITNGAANPAQISSIKDNMYFTHNDTIGGDIESIDKEYHLWTINDAKEGDVLAFDNDTIVIFKNLYNSSTFHSYCHIEDGLFDVSKDDMPDWWEGKGFQPATKEQCDLLFTKMKEAGYEWDAEKKKLKKIEDKPLVIDEGKDEIDRSFTKMMLKDYTK